MERSLTRSFVVSLFVFAACVVLPCAVAAQRSFKVGDRVMASPSSLRDDKYWRPCTITEVHDFVPKKAYSLTCDPLTKGGSTSSFLVNADWVRPLAASDDTRAPDPTPAPGGNRGGMGSMGGITRTRPAPATVGGTQCFASNAGGGGGMEAAFRQSIVHTFEHAPQPGEDGRITVEIDSFTLGGSHAYRLLSDPRDAAGKTVYSARATFTTCTDYTRRLVYTKRTREFACFKNTAGQWNCEIVAAVNTNVNDETKNVDKPR